jgi:putative transposase
MKDYHLALVPDGEYHIFGRAVGAERLFREPGNYKFFLSSYQKYLSPIAGTFSYSLLPNHFHLLLRVKEEYTLLKYYNEMKRNKKQSSDMLPEFIMEQFSNLLNSYTKTINGLYGRKGSLFIDYLRRVEVKSGDQFKSTAFYVHKNPVHHGYCSRLDQWMWSSYNSILSGEPTFLLRDELLKRFGGVKEFIDYHSQPIISKERRC